MICMAAHRLRAAFLAALAAAAAALMTACATPDKPVRAALYDLGPPPASAAVDAGPGVLGAAPAVAPLILAEVDAAGAFDGTALLYRLGYDDAHQLRPYARARWSSPPAQLVRQRLRERLARERPVLDRRDSAGVARNGRGLQTLRVELEDFSHHFESPLKSAGMLRLRCTVTANTAVGEQLLAQRTFELQRPASSTDASGGVQALSAASDAAGEEIAAWLRALQ